MSLSVTDVASEVRVRSGAISALLLFDVSYAIDLAQVEQIWAATTQPPSRRTRLSTTPPKAIAFEVPPVSLPLGQTRLALKSGPREAMVSARCYDFGVIALSLRIPVQDQSWSGFVQLAAELDQAVGPAADAAIWEGLLNPLCEQLAVAIVRPSRSRLREDYLFGVVNQWHVPMTAVDLVQQIDLVPFLSGEVRPLADSARRDLLSQRFSYYTDDLVVLTWDRAFIYEPRADTDIADILEAANVQLLEHRYYDRLLDDELPRMYDLVEETRRAVYLLAPRRFAHLARNLHTLVAEVTELTEKVDNVLQVTEDVYLARVYGAALETLRVPRIGAAVDRKLAIIRDTYTALYDEASSSRGDLMEMTVVLLIALEIVLAFVR